MIAMKSLRSLVFILAILLVFAVSNFAIATDKFPVEPVESTTPGALCTSSPIRRYPENIIYCERDVNSQLKNQIIRMYDEKFGYSIRQMSRGDFKIDHFIPLSIGGSNSIENLWPQHKSVYKITDELEGLLFTKISEGRIKQVEAIRVIREAKHHLDQVPELEDYVRGL